VIEKARAGENDKMITCSPAMGLIGANQMMTGDEFQTNAI